MESLPEKTEAQLPKLADLYEDVELARNSDQLNWLLNNKPKPEWVRKHPNIKDHEYLSIQVVETLLTRMFKLFRIEVLSANQLLNSIMVTVRVHYLHPVTGEWSYHDGVGAWELQTKKDTGTLLPDFSNINRGAVPMALPIAKSVAIKDACHHLGKIFGRDLNRKDEALGFAMDGNLEPKKLRPWPAGHTLSIINAINGSDEIAKAEAISYYKKCLREYDIPAADQSMINSLILKG